MQDVHYKNHVIPAGHFVGVSPALAQMDPEIWGKDAEDFLPDRFIEGARPETEKALGSGACSAYLPFGAGRHRCIGEPFAYVQLKTILACFIQAFDFKYPTGRGFPKRDFNSLVVLPVKPVLVDYTRRSTVAVEEQGREE
jgi:sterol 14-demethylase